MIWHVAIQCMLTAVIAILLTIVYQPVRALHCNAPHGMHAGVFHYLPMITCHGTCSNFLLLNSYHEAIIIQCT